MRPGIDLTGRRFGALVVKHLDPAPKIVCNVKRRQWICECDCGNAKTVMAKVLANGDQTSCGCGRWRMAKNNENKRNKAND